MSSDNQLAAFPLHRPITTKDRFFSSECGLDQADRFKEKGRTGSWKYRAAFLDTGMKPSPKSESFEFPALDAETLPSS